MANESAFIGTELKFQVLIEAGGFSMEDDDYEIVISCGNKSIPLTQDDVRIDDQGNYFIVIDTTEFKKGDVYATTYAHVPDSDFPDGKRTEIDRKKLITLKKI